ncbi:MAG: hypothetical protein A2V77_01310 [Anaeromyxobacter sp. RBG_16_69_14]|nr:MAG: hypothetical protein A2V77_01310 [Anaeromyxobacter sp. RBG_16_69_14]
MTLLSGTPVSSPSDDALRLVRERGLLTLTAGGAGPSLAEAIAGESVRGACSGAPAGERIFEIATALEASPEVLALKLVGGKMTFLHRALWPALVRIARDPDRVAEVLGRLSPGAARLHAEVERLGEVRLDELAREPAWPPERDLARAAKELEAALLVHSASVHTERGRLAIALRSWARAVPDSARREAAHLSLMAAYEAMSAHGAALPSSRRERPARPPTRAR